MPAQAQVSNTPVTILIYHAPGGPEPDPLATPLAPPPASALRLPATTFDRVERASNNPESAPARSEAHMREFQRILGIRETVPAPVELRVGGALAPGALEIEASLLGEPRAVRLELVVFEHDEAPYAARFALSPLELTVPANLTERVRLDPSWTPDKLGVVAIVIDEKGEALQSATWLVRDDASSVQTTRAVLVEHVTASWCEPCRPVDAAVALLGEQRGAAGGVGRSGEIAYLRPPTWQLWLGLALGGAAGIALARRSTA